MHSRFKVALSVLALIAGFSPLAGAEHQPMTIKVSASGTFYDPATTPPGSDPSDPSCTVDVSSPVDFVTVSSKTSDIYVSSGGSRTGTVSISGNSARCGNTNILIATDGGTKLQVNNAISRLPENKLYGNTGFVCTTAVGNVQSALEAAKTNWKASSGANSQTWTCS